MAKAQEKQAFITSTSPIPEQDHEGRDIDDLDEEQTSSPNGCCFFRLFCFDRNAGENRRLVGGENTETWVEKRAKKLKEVSELVAGPKWKNLIRRIGRYIKGEKKSRNQFNYDPQSYALNFDHGEEGEEGEDYRFGATDSSGQQWRTRL